MVSQIVDLNANKSENISLIRNQFIGRKKSKDQDACDHPPPSTDKNIGNSPPDQTTDDLYEDKETSVVPTLTCNATSTENTVHTPVRSSQPIEIFNPMGYVGHEPLTAGDADSQYEHFSGSASVLSKSPVSPRVRSLQHDMQALRRSRQDNPYIQHKLERLSLQEEPPYSSPRKQEQEKLVDSEDDSEMDDDIVNLHEHLIRSPPPQFPVNVSQFMFPDRGDSPRHHQTLASSTESISHQPADSPVVPVIRPEGGLFRTKGSLPLLPIEEVQNVSTDINRRSNSFQKSDLNPLLIKSGVDMLDPSMREVLEFQKHKIVYDNRVDPVINSPGDTTGRMSVDAALHHHSGQQSYQRVGSLNGKLQPMWSPPATAPSFPTSPRPVSFPTGGPVVIGGPSPASSFSPLPNVNAPSVLPPVALGLTSTNDAGLRPVKGVRMLPANSNPGANGSRALVN